MRRLSVALGVLGLVLAALPAHAAEVTLFGKKYSIVTESRGQTFKNGKTVTLADDVNKKANLCFVQGADPSQDRLFVGAPINVEPAHQFYLLRGADANGVFSKDAAEMVEFFGGSVELVRGGRPVSVLHINDVNAGVKQDRNLALFTFDDGDGLEFYDLDTLSGSYDTDALLKILQPEEGGENPDPGMPNGDFSCLALGPNGTVVVAGRAVADEEGNRNQIEIGVIDPKKDAFFNVLTNLSKVSQDSTVKIEPQDPNTEPNAFVHAGGSEYWMIVSGDQQGSNDATETQFLYRMELTFPEDLAKGTPGSIKARVLARETLKGTPMATSDGGVFGMTLGREVNGGRRLYMADWAGNVHTLTPLP